ncbi:hypothetical protein ABZY57_08040 [Streptomyces sp. NPDC006450]|uniref:hypothetical protein n=1 Tax=Streptomyces sp. NPDC006450 TaxID=3155458 RepID=UPI00339EF179
MTPPRMYFATAALSALALGVAMASGWGQDFPDGESHGSASGSGFSLSAWAADWASGATHVEANVQHADVTPRPAGDIIWN